MHINLYLFRAFNSHHWDAERFTDELMALRAALADAGVTDGVLAFHIMGSYGPFLDPNAHNEIWIQKV
jgi:hypothetical protein